MDLTRKLVAILYADVADYSRLARLEAAAKPGGICVSSAFYDQVEGKTLLQFSDGGEESFKNIARPVRVYHWQPEVAANVQRTAAKHAKPSIAVLPFLNMSGDAEQEYFADGITEDLITALSKIRSFLVIARNSTFTYKGQALKTQLVHIKSTLATSYDSTSYVARSGRY